MSKVLRALGHWYVALVLLVGLGAGIGYAVFFHVYPGKPKIGVIDIPFTVLDSRSAPTISAFLDYARDRDDIKAVVIILSSPGSSGGAGEQLYTKVRQLREHKPVVISMQDIATSGAYMMSVPANYIYAHAGTITGSVGVFVSLPSRFPTVPEVPDERVIRTGPQKFLGGTTRDWMRWVDQLKEGFYRIVATERGDKLRLTKDELLEASIYFGGEAAALGLVDAIGGDDEAIKKAAELANISNYELVDVNTEVLRISFEKLARIIEPLGQDSSQGPDLASIGALLAPRIGTGEASGTQDPAVSIAALRRLLLPAGQLETNEELSGIGVSVGAPPIYHLYVEPVP